VLLTEKQRHSEFPPLGACSPLLARNRHSLQQNRSVTEKARILLLHNHDGKQLICKT